MCCLNSWVNIEYSNRHLLNDNNSHFDLKRESKTIGSSKGLIGSVSLHIAHGETTWWLEKLPIGISKKYVRLDKDSVEETAKNISIGWETKDALVVEGPFVIKYENKYYLTYSANHTRSHHYAVGYAVSNSPLGPFKKYENNPILFQNGIFYGLGHHSFTTTKDKKKLIIACHSRFIETKFIKDMNNETILMIEDMNNKID